jgi:hypothetical protein
MRFSTTITIFGLLATTALTIPTSPLFVTIALYVDPTCSTSAYSILELSSDLCYPIIGAQGLKVVKHAAGLPYNACK